VKAIPGNKSMFRQMPGLMVALVVVLRQKIPVFYEVLSGRFILFSTSLKHIDVNHTCMCD